MPHNIACFDFADQDSVQMLQRSSQIGEFYRMSPPPVWDVSKKLPGQYMDIMIYDEETDQLKHIPFSQAVFACCLESDAFMKAIQWEKQEWDANGKLKNCGANPIAKETTMKQLVEHVAAGWWAPVCITIARPFIEHTMMSAVAAVAGKDTGATLFGPADMQISANTSVKTIEGEQTPRRTN